MAKKRPTNAKPCLTQNPGPSDIDVLGLIFAPLPAELAEAYLRATMPHDFFAPEEGAPCPGGFGV